MGQSRGFIFLMTLITIAVISLLVLTCMQHILLYFKAMNALEVQHHQFYQLETLASQLVAVKKEVLDKYCVEQGDAPNQIMQRLLKHEGCPLEKGNLKYQYLIEELGDFPCLVARIKGQKVSTHHRRVSLLQVSDDDKQESFIQLRNVVAINALSCLEEEHEVKLGISSWRYFAGV